jgi:hypothetical protein
LAGAHDSFDWKLGLSATPERAYDASGNDFIAKELGTTLYEFPLEAAIRRGVLSEFDYLPLAYELTDGDRERLQAVYAKKAARARDGNPMRDEELWTEIAKVYKTAEMKPEVFAEHLANHQEWLNRAIIFVETKEYGAQVLTIIDRYTHRYRTYYAEDDRGHLVSFAQGEIDTLITCHRVSQGIDIRSLSTVVLFASARARRRGQIAGLWASVTKYAERLRDGLGVGLPAHRPYRCADRATPLNICRTVSVRASRADFKAAVLKFRNNSAFGRAHRISGSHSLIKDPLGIANVSRKFIGNRRQRPV